MGLEFKARSQWIQAAKWQTEGRINELQLFRNLIKSYIKPGILLKDFVLTLIKAVSHWEAILILYQDCNSVLKMASLWGCVHFFKHNISPPPDLSLASRQESICQNNDRNAWKTIALLWTLLLWTTVQRKSRPRTMLR